MPRQLKILILIIIDILLVGFSYVAALALRFDFQIPASNWASLKQHIWIFIALQIIVFILGRMYHSLWKYASIRELVQIMVTIGLSNAVVVAYAYLSIDFFQVNYPRSAFLISTIIDIFLVGGVRIAYRVIPAKIRKYRGYENKKRVLIVGAGDAGAMLMKEINNHTELNSKVVAFVDDDVKKKGMRISGAPVVSTSDDIPKVVKKYQIDEIVIAIPSASKGQVQEIVSVCKKTKAKLKILPGIYEIIGGMVKVSHIRDVQIEDLLGREQVRLDMAEIRNFLKYKTVMVTGAGGSIGSELCRQIALFQPKELILLEIYENSVYDLEHELRGTFQDINLKVVIASVRDRKRIEEVMDQCRPEVIFHAAAHKHVPLMENNPKEAVKNNVFGTLNLAQMADRYGVKKFVLISTDKAVNPTNIMGATKRLCEMIVQSIDRESKTEFAAVRFGNVLGSNGSVIPLFKNQIAKGGPVTITHEDIIRYFMSIPEAAQLVLQAGAMAQGGEIFILDMGEPVKIMDLAQDLIRLSGFEPGVDMKIEVTGLRPGEKLYEELLLDEEGISKTIHEKIFVGKPIFTDYSKILAHLDELRIAMDSQNANVKHLVSQIVPTYKVYEEKKMQKV
ncbi:polysaccharide biosynthesis protein [Alkalibacter rhizosphaerae]|uniref:Polysaccharide biosynthesis protein n=1 Tax=Alkalibacter rhizosphaerae TaxID=2815577 RepID=A0A974XDQ7_9FIRM|nr:nucleoside-diphosphate sugar epimerase/dehydratase [Alkalibacter rhizosphaerae]QSX07949.1 polysaccharide biosynthesis protein [Alkalibacter rhizosphaerae]